MIKKTIKIPLFWKIYITVVTIILIGFVVLWSILWTALKSMSSHDQSMLWIR